MKPLINRVEDTNGDSKTETLRQARGHDKKGAVAESEVRPPRSRSKVSWTMVNFCLDSWLLVNFLGLVWVSTIVRFVFPIPSAAQGWMLWGFHLDHWWDLQFVLVALLTLGILVHLMLHWSWICGVVFTRLLRKRGRNQLPDDGTRTIYGVGMMIAILNVMGLAIAAAAICIRSP